MGQNTPGIVQKCREQFACKFGSVDVDHPYELAYQQAFLSCAFVRLVFVHPKPLCILCVGRNQLLIFMDQSLGILFLDLCSQAELLVVGSSFLALASCALWFPCPLL